ncbi:MAG TPA: Gfo/Idh/MocA family oxidoreductase [Humisphaera sp.]|jgi:predicted dehydrogenase|nr:Gfo/Idh/MocA family oxidoreductase [Humisphaera sp.]
MSNQPISRRQVLSNAAAGAAGVALAAAAARPIFAADSAAAASPATMRWGIIGTGARGTTVHIPVLKAAPESQLVALCDISEKRLANAASKVDHPVPTYTDYQKLLANPDVNAVIISAPNLLHREMLQAALQAGKHVLCEKPAGTNEAETAAIKKLIEGAKTTVMFGMQYRNGARQKKIGELVASGEIGKPRYMVQACSRGDWNLSPEIWRYSDPKLGGKPMNWRFSHAASGGTLAEFDCHYFDILHWIAGAAPQRISCDGGIAVYHDGRDTWDHASLVLTYPDGLTAVHTLCLFGPGRADLTVVGESGSLESIGDALRLVSKGKPAQDVRPPATPKKPYDEATLGLFEDFLACMKTGKKPEAGIDRAVMACRTCWLGELSAQRKAEVSWEQTASA